MFLECSHNIPYDLFCLGSFISVRKEFKLSYDSLTQHHLGIVPLGSFDGLKIKRLFKQADL